jgi:O-antigen/teichoic acid export membrane protein
MGNASETPLSPANESSGGTGYSSVSRNATLNVLGSVIPMFVTLATVPPYLRLIGDVRFGVLSLVWVFLSYFGLFEMGLGRATSKYIAELKDDSEATREAVFWTALLVNLAVGTLGGAFLWLLAGTTLPFWLKANGTIQVEVARAMPWLAAAVPVATVTSVLVGALEGREKFAVINSQQIGATIAFQLIPLSIAAWVGPRVDWLIAATVAARMAANLPLLFVCARHVPLRSVPRIDRKWLRRLFSYGAWITVSGIVGPILTSLDRFVIGVVQGAQAVTYYAIPYNFAFKLLIIPSSLQRALFPRFSAQRSADAQEMAGRAVLALAGMLTPIVVVAVLLTQPFFRLWVGPTVAARCTRPAEWMLIGVFVNALAFVPYGLLQAQGRPDLAAKFHVAELVPFVGLLWVGVHIGGVTGAAVVWCARAAADAVLLFFASGIWRVVIRLTPAIVLISLAFLAATLVGNHLALRSALLVLLGTSSFFVSQATSPEVTRLVVSRVRAVFGRNRIGVMPKIDV